MDKPGISATGIIARGPADHAKRLGYYIDDHRSWLTADFANLEAALRDGDMDRVARLTDSMLITVQRLNDDVTLLRDLARDA